MGQTGRPQISVRASPVSARRTLVAGASHPNFLVPARSPSSVLRLPLKRYPSLDPPEYVEWTPDPELVREYRRRATDDPARRACVERLGRAELLGLYRDLLLTRLQDLELKRWVRHGKISKAWLGTGEEAVTVGAVAALDRDADVVSPMIRNAGACHMMGMALEHGFTGYLATSDSPNGGRDLHVGDLRHGVVQPISHMGTSATIVAGAALAFRSRGEARAALTWIGDGATRTAACHEGLVFAAHLRVPAIFVVQNNQVALGTRADLHTPGKLDEMPAAYGIAAYACDGNNVLDVYSATALARERCVADDGPAVVVAETFRMGGHATHDEREARQTFSDRRFQEWGRRDPVGLFEAYLADEGVPAPALAEVEEAAVRAVSEAAERALASRERLPAPERALYEGVSEGGVLHMLARRLEDDGLPPRTLANPA